MGFFQSLKELERHENMVVNDIVEGIYYSSDKERIRIMTELDRKRKRDWSIRDIQYDDKKNVITYIHKNNFKLN